MELTTVLIAVICSLMLFMMSKIQNLNGTHNIIQRSSLFNLLFMMSKIQNLNGTHNLILNCLLKILLFMMSKIQNLNGTHNGIPFVFRFVGVVYDVKDTKFE